MVRLFEPPAGTTTENAAANVTIEGTTLVACSPGEWGNHLAVSVATAGTTAGLAQVRGVAPADLGELFNLSVTYTDRGGASTVERFDCVTLLPRYRALFLALSAPRNRP
jgi:hypothetical protein